MNKERQIMMEGLVSIDKVETLKQLKRELVRELEDEGFDRLDAFEYIDSL